MTMTTGAMIDISNDDGNGVNGSKLEMRGGRLFLLLAVQNFRMSSKILSKFSPIAERQSLSIHRQTGDMRLLVLLEASNHKGGTLVTEGPY